MLDNLKKEILDFWGNKVPQQGILRPHTFFSDKTYGPYLVQVKWESYPDDESHLRFVVTLELSDPTSGSKAQQEFSMGSYAQVDSFLHSEGMIELLQVRLERLKTALENIE